MVQGEAEALVSASTSTAFMHPCAYLLDSHAYKLNTHSCHVIFTAPVKLPPDEASICMLSGILISGKLIDQECNLHTPTL